MAADSITISLSSASAPATQYVDQSFAGFGIEPSNLFQFTGGENTNDLSINLLSNLGKYTGEPSHNYKKIIVSNEATPAEHLPPSQVNHHTSASVATQKII